MKKNRWRKQTALIISAVVAALSLAGCGGQEPAQVQEAAVRDDIETVSSSVDTVSAETKNILDPEDMFTSRDLSGDYDVKEATAIELTGDSASCSDQTVVVSGNTVTVTQEGVYVLTGRLKGMIVVDAPDSDKVQLVLDGVEITNETNACIYAKRGDKLFLTLAQGSLNTLSGVGYAEPDGNRIDGVIFSKCDLTVNGSGGLEINAAQGNGVVTKDDLVLAAGAITVTAEGHGLEGKDSVRIADGQLAIVSGKDGIHSENDNNQEKGFVYIADGKFAIVSDGDGISASGLLQIDGGNYSIVCGGGSGNTITVKDADGSDVSAKGVKAGGELAVNGGTISVDSQDDAVHAGGDLTVTGGELQLAVGDDGLHSDGTAVISGGYLQIIDGYEGIEGNSVVISGGEIHINVTDDGLNAAGGKDQSGFRGAWGGDMFAGSSCVITISGGKIYINAAGDGIDSNGDLVVTGGEIYVSGPESPADGALDYDGAGQITGGILVAVGSSQMAMNFGDMSTQGSILVNVGNCRTGDEVRLEDESGNLLVAYTAESAFTSVVVSCPELKLGETYKLTAGENETQITLDTLIYGNGMGMGGPGGFGMPGGRGGQGGFGGWDGGRQGRDDGRRQDWQGGEGSEFPEGEMPDGGMPGFPEGEMPDGGMPEGRIPSFPGGNMPEGERPESSGFGMPGGVF